MAGSRRRSGGGGGGGGPAASPGSPRCRSQDNSRGPSSPSHLSAATNPGGISPASTRRRRHGRHWGGGSNGGKGRVAECRAHRSAACSRRRNCTVSTGERSSAATTSFKAVRPRRARLFFKAVALRCSYRNVRGMTPARSALSRTPSIVKLLPVPVCKVQPSYLSTPGARRSAAEGAAALHGRSSGGGRGGGAPGRRRRWCR